MDEPVQLMSLKAEGAYRRLLDHQWLHGSIPAARGSQARICKQVGEKEMREIWDEIAPCFRPHPEDPDRLVNQKLERIRAEQQTATAKKSAAGTLGAEATWQGKEARQLYAMRRASDGAIKIGWSRNPERRRHQLMDAGIGDLELLVARPGSLALERQAQIDLAAHRIGTEWFTDSIEVRQWIDRHLHGDTSGKTAGETNGETSGRLGNRESEEESEPETPPASPSSSGARYDGAAAGAIEAQLPEAYRPAFRATLLTARNPVAFLAELRAQHAGMPGHGPGYAWDIIGHALHDIQVAGAPASPRSIRRFCEDLVTGKSADAAAVGNETEAEAALRRHRAKEGQVA